MGNKLFIAVDLGGSHGRMFSGGLGVPLTLEYEFPTRFFKYDNSGNYCWDIDFIYSNILTGIKQIHLKYDKFDVISIGIDCFGNDHGLLDVNDKLCAPIFHGKSSRTFEVSAVITSLMGGTRNLYNLTGINITYYDTINQLYSAKQEMPEKYREINSILLLPDLFGFWLTEIKQTERTAISVTQLYNPVKFGYEPSILNMLELSPGCLPPIMETGSYRGLVSLAICNKLGMKPGLKFVNVAEHDTASSVSTLMTGTNDFMFISSGTMSVVGCIIDNPILNDLAFNYQFSNETAVSGKIRLLKNYLGMWILNECKKSWADSSINFEVLDREARSELQFPSAINPEDQIFIAPNSVDNPMPDRVSIWCKMHGQLVPSNRGQIMVAIYKGLAQKYLQTLNQLREVTKKEFQRIMIIGGGSKNRILNQLTANCCGIEVITGLVEASATGNIIIQMKTSGEIDSYAEGLAAFSEYEKIEHYLPLGG